MKQPRVIRNHYSAVTARGFSKWAQPRMAKFFMACCDCSLVHEMQFRIMPGRVLTDNNGGQKMHVQFRARRAEAFTRRERAKRKS